MTEAEKGAAAVRNHDQKQRDMARSVLPSKRRSAAREDRRILHRTARSRVRTAIKSMIDFDDDLQLEIVDRKRAVATTDLVWSRRYADKVEPLLRWAEAIIAADPKLRTASVDEQVAHFARVLPDNLPGRHALDHIRWQLEWRARFA